MARSTKESSTRQSSRADARGTTATQLLRKDHETVKKLFARFEKQGERAQETKQSIFSEIQRELETHSTIEEEIFYPAVREGVAGTEDLVDESLEEHNVVKSLLHELGSMSAEDEEFDAKMTVLRENVEHHIQEEEGEMFPKVEAQLGHERLQQIGAQLQARKDALGQPTIKRIMSGVSGLIFGNGESTEAAETARTETGGRRGSERRSSRAQARSGGSASARTETNGGTSERTAGGGRRRSAGKSSAKQRGASKKGTGARAAQKLSSASVKKRSSRRTAETKGSARRSRGQKRTAAGGGNRRRTSGRSSKRR